MSNRTLWVHTNDRTYRIRKKTTSFGRAIRAVSKHVPCIISNDRKRGQHVMKLETLHKQYGGSVVCLDSKSFFVSKASCQESITTSTPRPACFPTIMNARELQRFIEQLDSAHDPRVDQTLRYYHDFLAIGIVVSIRNQKIVRFHHITNMEFKNHWKMKIIKKNCRICRTKKTRTALPRRN